MIRSLTARLGDRSAAVVDRLLETWEDETARRLAELDAAVDAGDAEALGRTAHAIKGGSASLGAVGLAEVCRSVEDPIRQGEPVDPDAEQLDLAPIAQPTHPLAGERREPRHRLAERG